MAAAEDTVTDSSMFALEHLLQEEGMGSRVWDEARKENGTSGGVGGTDGKGDSVHGGQDAGRGHDSKNVNGGRWRYLPARIRST